KLGRCTRSARRGRYTLEIRKPREADTAPHRKTRSGGDEPLVGGVRLEGLDELHDAVLANSEVLGKRRDFARLIVADPVIKRRYRCDSRVVQLHRDLNMVLLEVLLDLIGKVIPAFRCQSHVPDR